MNLERIDGKAEIDDNRESGGVFEPTAMYFRTL